MRDGEKLTAAQIKSLCGAESYHFLSAFIKLEKQMLKLYCQP
jgi:hypothetical protein